jgi:hypothetical protein
LARFGARLIEEQVANPDKRGFFGATTVDARF